MPRNTRKKLQTQTRGWDAVADWYDGWMGETGSHHHQRLAIPAALDLLDLQPGEHLLDLGCGQGVFSQYAALERVHYTGVDISPRMVALARRRHAEHGRFVQGDARRLDRIAELRSRQFNAVVFLLSIQDMNPLDRVLEAASHALKPGGRLVIVMTHPCFRVPRQSGWGHDPARNLRYRRVDAYLEPLSVPMKAYGRGSGTTISFHRPLGTYINALSETGLMVDALREISTFREGKSAAEQRAHDQIPLFAALRARCTRV